MPRFPASRSLALRFWRVNGAPIRLNKLVGQQHVLTALTNALDQGRLHHAYLLSGTRGVGKTTIARILAKSLNCEQGISSHPCGVCDTCREIDQGNSSICWRSMRRPAPRWKTPGSCSTTCSARPARGRFKVYLIDEVHMLSRHSFNALLKTLEEPPPLCEVPAGHHESAEAAHHHLVPLPAVPPRKPGSDPDRQAARMGAGSGRSAVRAPRPAGPGQGRRWQHARCPEPDGSGAGPWQWQRAVWRAC